jgi:hypothetical protein
MEMNLLHDVLKHPKELELLAHWPHGQLKNPDFSPAAHRLPLPLPAANQVLQTLNQ